MRNASKNGTKKARTLRRAMSLPEVILWQALRKRPGALKFRRQHPCGPFVLDFYCEAARLAVEVDGESHNFQGTPVQDERRDRWLTDRGISVLRISARDVFADLDAVVRHIFDRCEPLHRPPAGPPPLQGGFDD